MYKTSKSIDGKNIFFETGKMARQADGSILVGEEGTVVLVTAVSSKDAETDKDFFPLFVEYRAKFYAAGKIPGGFFKREGRPGEKETLGARLIDRPIRQRDGVQERLCLDDPLDVGIGDCPSGAVRGDPGVGGGRLRAHGRQQHDGHTHYSDGVEHSRVPPLHFCR